MVDIKDVKCDYILDACDNYRLLDIDELKEVWNTMTKDERTGLYTTKLKHYTFDAKDVIESALLTLCDDGYEEMYDKCLEDITKEQIKRLQAVLDDISDNASYYVFVEDRLINPESELD